VDVLILQVLVSLALVAGSVLLFIVAFTHRDFDHGESLALRPLDEDDAESFGSSR
jgi:hypothetical protein